MAVHIGENIRKRAKELRIGPTELGKLIHTSRQNIIGIYKRKSVDAEMLYKISNALHYDFFQFYFPEPLIAGEGEIEYKKLAANPSSKEAALFQKALTDVRKQLSELVKLQKKTIELLEKKK